MPPSASTDDSELGCPVVVPGYPPPHPKAPGAPGAGDVCCARALPRPLGAFGIRESNVRARPTAGIGHAHVQCQFGSWFVRRAWRGGRSISSQWVCPCLGHRRWVVLTRPEGRSLSCCVCRDRPRPLRCSLSAAFAGTLDDEDVQSRLSGPRHGEPLFPVSGTSAPAPRSWRRFLARQLEAVLCVARI